jgi:hypothetical protein
LLNQEEQLLNKDFRWFLGVYYLVKN